MGAVRTRTRANREDSRSPFVPSRHVIVRQACFGRLSANCFDAHALLLQPTMTLGRCTHFDRRHDGRHIAEPHLG